MLNGFAILRVLGILQLLLTLFFLVSLPVAMLYGNSLQPLAFSGLITLGSGALCFWLGGAIKPGSIQKREGYLVVFLCWLIMPLTGMLPFLFSGDIPHVADAFFESVSGYTTTGASILTDIESVRKDILFWRSFIQWIGGMGIIVLTVAILPFLGIGGNDLFMAEAPGPTSEKIHPRIQETARRLWLLYLGLTLLLIGLLKVGGMSLFDAINHAFTTMATGGFSTRNNSIAAFTSPYIQYILALFMFIAGTNYMVLYLAFKRKWASVWRMDEFKAYLLLVLLAAFPLTLQVHLVSGVDLERSFRDSLFQVISLITTTGFITADYLQWGTFAVLLLFLLLFVGGCAGSTSGGVKVIRSVVFFRNTYLEFKRILHPNAILALKINRETVRGRVTTHVMIFLLLYIATFCVGSLWLTFLGYDLETSIGAVATCLGNVGPGIGKVGPVYNFSWMSDSAKYILSFLMLLGRLELFTMFILFTPHFWRLN